MDLRDQNDKWVLQLTISEELWKKTQIATKSNVISLLISARALVTTIKSPADHPNSMAQVCAGLYTYALEEYGKLLYLLECKPENGEVVIEYRRKFRNHDFKIEKAASVLPQECLRMHTGAFLPGPGNFKGGTGNFDVHIDADLATRLLIFHTDFRDDGMVVESPPTVDVPLLDNAISTLDTIVHDFELKR